MSLTTHGDRSGMTEPKMVTPMLSFVPKREDEDEDEEVRFRNKISILGARSAQQMGLITLHSEVIQEIQLKAPPLTRETVIK